MSFSHNSQDNRPQFLKVEFTRKTGETQQTSGFDFAFFLLLIIGSAKFLQTVSAKYIEDAAKNWKQLEEELHRKVPIQYSKSSEHQDNLS